MYCVLVCCNSAQHEDEEAAERYRRMGASINEYGEQGVVEVLEAHDCDAGPQPSHAYLPCCLRLQNKHVRHFRHTLFVTSKPWRQLTGTCTKNTHGVIIIFCMKCKMINNLSIAPY